MPTLLLIVLSAVIGAVAGVLVLGEPDADVRFAGETTRLAPPLTMRAAKFWILRRQKLPVIEFRA
ncbi:MAG TPA: hypothetical protein VKK06_14105 [Terriglobia bacterium]|nr:hypothetical protein [Terriglobia bacterium]